MVTGMDGIVFWGPLLIHTIMDGDSGSGDALMPSSYDVCMAVRQKLVMCRRIGDSCIQVSLNQLQGKCYLTRVTPSQHGTAEA